MKFLLLKHFRGDHDIAANALPPTDQWTPEEFENHVAFMENAADDLQESGEFVVSHVLMPEGEFVRYDGEGRPPVTDGPFAETKDLIAGFMIVDVESQDRAYEIAAHLSSAPGPGGTPIREWIEVRPIMAGHPSVTE